MDNKQFQSSEEIHALKYADQLIQTAIYLKDTNGIYTGCNPFFSSLLKLQNQGYVIGKTDLDMPWKEQAQEIQESDDKVLKMGLSFEVETHFNLPNDEKIFVLISKSPLRGSDDQIIGLIASLIDLRKQKDLEAAMEKNKREAEARIKIEQYVQTLMFTKIGICWCKDKEGRYLGCNQAAAYAWDLSSPDEVVGKTDYELPWSMTADTLVAHDKIVMQTGKTLMERESITTKYGLPLVFLVTKEPLIDQNGVIIGTLGTSMNITDFIRACQ